MGTLIGHRPPTTEQVVVNPTVLAKLLAWGARHPEHEVGGFLLGRLEDALYVERIHLVRRKGTQTHIVFEPRDYEDAADQTEDGQTIVGLAHTHPGFGVFLSATDVETQLNGQELFPDYVSLVMDPFHETGIETGFFRVRRSGEVEVDWKYGDYTCNTKDKSSSKDGTSKPFEKFTPRWAGAVHSAPN